MAAGLLQGLEAVRRNWGWFLALGMLLIFLGTAAIVHAFAATLVSMFVLGWLLMGSGLAQGILAVQTRTWSGFFLHVLGGVLEFVIGLLIVGAPVAAAAGFTLLLAAYLLIGGLFRMIAALSLGFPGAPWVAVGGFISFILGIALWRQWPYSAAWFIGMCVGIDLVWNGAAWVMFALGARQLPHATGV